MIEHELQDALKELNREISVPPASRILHINFRDLFERAIKEIQLLRTTRQTGEGLMTPTLFTALGSGRYASEDELQDVVTRAHSGADNYNAITHMVMVPLDLLERAIKEIQLLRTLVKLEKP